MNAVIEKEAKAERIEIRVTPSAKALLNAAAQARQTTISEFLLSNGIEAAEKAVSMPRVFYATEEGWEALQKLLDEEEKQEPSPAAVAWLSRRPMGS